MLRLCFFFNKRRWYCDSATYAGECSMVARRSPKPLVVGSIPNRPCQFVARKRFSVNNDIIFTTDVAKKSVRREKGYDFMDGSPRYTFEGRDPATTIERFQVVIYRERNDCGTFGYYGYVRDNKLESADTIGPFRTLKEAKVGTLKLFNDFLAYQPTV